MFLFDVYDFMEQIILNYIPVKYVPISNDIEWTLLLRNREILFL